MDLVLGKASSFATNKPLPESNNQDMASVGSVTMDNRRQRLFVGDGIRVSRHEARNRLLVFDVHPDRVRDHAEAIAVIGQPDFETNEPGVGPATFGGGSRSAIDEEDDWLFAVDGTNNRVLVFDVHPERLQSGPDAIAVIGQPDFDSREARGGPAGMSRPAFVAYDSAYRRLFVTDAGNQRILVFDVPRDGMRNNQEAIAVLGQPDFNTRDPRTNPRKAAPSDIAIEPDTQRLFVSEIGNNRILVFDVHPDRLQNNPDAINVIGQPDFDYTDFDPTVSRNTTRSPHQVAIDSENQLAYMVDGFTGRNAVTIFDIHPERLEDQPDAVDLLGRLDDAGEVDFERRPPNDVINGRFSAEIRSLALDPVDHRLIAGDQYNHRVVIWQLDDDNRVQNRVAEWAIGQPDVDSSYLRQRSARTLKKPYALAYDTRHKRLFIAETLSDRISVWDLEPSRMQLYPEAIAVIGQQDFETRLPQRTRNGLFLGDSMGHGIGSAGPRPTGLAMDVDNQRLFVSDASNHRVMVFDVDPERLENHPEAIAVLGQPDFTSGIGPAPGALSVDSTALTAAAQGSRAAQSTPAATADSLFWPSALDYDAVHGRLFVGDGFNHRVMVFEASPDRLRNGASAIAVIGQPDFTSNTPGMSRSGFQWPDGVAYDSSKDQLYVTDMGNDRVLVFDVAPERLRNGSDAVAVLGQTSFDTWRAGPEQDELADPRDIEFDSENQRLFVADSYQTRILTYDMPATNRAFEIPGFGARRYSTLDWKSAARSVGYAVVESNSPESLAAVSILTFSEQIMDPISERESRVLHGEVAFAAPAPVSDARIFVDPNMRTRVVLNNPGGETARLIVSVNDLSGEAIGRARRIVLDAGEQQVILAAELAGREFPQATILHIRSDVAISVQGLAATGTVPQTVISEAPTVTSPAEGILNIPRVIHGGGYQSRIILINPCERTLRGRIEIHGLGGAGSREVATEPYEIAAGGAYLAHIEPRIGLARTGYAIVRPENGDVPTGGAWISLHDGEDLVNRTFVAARSVSNRAWVPVNTFASTTRHGRASVRFTIVNNGAVPAAGANIRINLFAPDGSFVERYEQNLPVGAQWDVSLVELSQRDRFRGTARIVSDVPVVVSATQSIENVRERLIEVELPVVDRESIRSGSPILIDGEGIASEVILLNHTETAVAGSLEFFSADGQPREMILR